MKYLHLIWAALFRSKTRTFLTLLSVITAFLLFGMLDSVRVAFNSSANVEGYDRLIATSKLSITQSLPYSLLSQIESVPGVANVAGAQWFGGIYQDTKNFFPNFAVDPKFMTLYPEYVLPPDQLKAFQASQGRPSSGELDEQTWDLLTAPMRKALVKIENAGSMSLDELAITIAKQHLAQKPIEIGGNNHGPWVRLYMAGRDGEDQLWCAGFVCFVVDQACRELKIAMPFKRQVFVPTLVNEARATGRLVNAAELNTPQA